MTDRTTEIEKRIDKEIAGALAVGAGRGGGVSVVPRNMGEMMEFAKMMATGGFVIRAAFRGNPGACLAVAMQALRWGADPIALCNKAYVVKNKAGEDQVSYEAQAIHAAVNESPKLSRRLRPAYEGAGPSRKCKIVGWLVGEDEPFEYESPPVSQINPKNSPLWVSDPDQQLFYYSTRAWARRHLPEVLLGVYARDEMEDEARAAAATDVTPPPPRPDRRDYAAARDVEPEPDPVWTLYDDAGEMVREFKSAGEYTDALIAMMNDPARDYEAVLGANDQTLFDLELSPHKNSCHDVIMGAASRLRARDEKAATAPQEGAGEPAAPEATPAAPEPETPASDAPAPEEQPPSAITLEEAKAAVSSARGRMVRMGTLESLDALIDELRDICDQMTAAGFKDQADEIRASYRRRKNMLQSNAGGGA